MNIQLIKQTVVRGGHRGILLARKHSPVILTAVGIVGGITSAVLASKATLKLEAIIDDTSEYAEITKQGVRATGRDSLQRELAFVYTRGAIDVVKLYAPALTVGVASIACIVGAQGIMQKRN